MEDNFYTADGRQKPTSGYYWRANLSTPDESELQTTPKCLEIRGVLHARVGSTTQGGFQKGGYLMTTDVDLVVLTGQSNAGLIGGDTLSDAIDINGTMVTGTALELACAEADSMLGFGAGTTVDAVYASGSYSGDVVTETGTAFAKHLLIRR